MKIFYITAVLFPIVFLLLSGFAPIFEFVEPVKKENKSKQKFNYLEKPQFELNLILLNNFDPESMDRNG